MENDRYRAKSDEKMAEGIYIGITASAKKLYAIIRSEPIGISFQALGMLLQEKYNTNPQKARELALMLEKQMDSQGHSGCSEAVVIQMLFDILGARVMAEHEYKYARDITKEQEEIIKEINKMRKK